jgi:hypothetical protein
MVIPASVGTSSGARRAEWSSPERSRRQALGNGRPTPAMESRPAGRHDPPVGSHALEETAKVTLAHLSAYPPRGSLPGLTVRATTSLCDIGETEMGLNRWPEHAAPPNGAPEEGGRSCTQGCAYGWPWATS